MSSPRLRQLYNQKILPELNDVLGCSNIMQVPKLSKIVLNVGVKDATTDSKALRAVEKTLEQIAGQKPCATSARKSIAGFKLREGMQIGVKVTLRHNNMYEFLDRLISIALPKTRDFQGIPVSFDKDGNYNLGIKEWIIFPEVDYDTGAKIRGMNISFVTTAKDKKSAYELLKRFGMPFKRTN